VARVLSGKGWFRLPLHVFLIKTVGIKARALFGVEELVFVALNLHVLVEAEALPAQQQQEARQWRSSAPLSEPGLDGQ